MSRSSHLPFRFPLHAGFLLFIVTFLAAPSFGQAAALEALTFVTRTGEYKFQVEVADTDATRARGLMQRRAMPQDHGMIFDFKVEMPVSMWMKNTYIPLDMIFVSRQGMVVSIATDTQPMSERIIDSGAPVYAVIELNAGSAQRMSLAAGDTVRHRVFAR